MKRVARSVPGLTALLVALSLAAGATPAGQEMKREVEFRIPSQQLAAAILAFSEQAGLQIVTLGSNVAGLKSTGVSGKHRVEDALRLMLKGTGLTFNNVDDGTVSLVHQATAKAAGPDQASLSAQDHDLRLVLADPGALADGDAGESGRQFAGADPADAMQKGTPEILVKGTRSTNADIRRTEDDIQPYVVFDAEQIERSMAPDLQTFLTSQLPMNQVGASSAQNLGNTRSTIDLRGLGQNQTLVLVNGRRLPGVATGADFVQSDVNGIPLSSIQRIEVLPSTAGGIFGGGATGGVVNIVLKRDYQGLELRAVYDGTFSGGAVQRRLEANGGMSLEGGRTSVTATASYRESGSLYAGDRDFSVRSRALLRANNPAYFRQQTLPPFGYTTNIRSVSGNNLVLAANLQSLGSPFAHVPRGYGGADTDGGLAFLGTAGEYVLEPSDDYQGLRAPLQTAPGGYSATLNLRREFAGWLDGFLDVARHDNTGLRPYSIADLGQVLLPPGPNNPFTETVRVAVPLVGLQSERRFSLRSEQAVAGAIFRLPGSWTAHAEYNWSRSRAFQGNPSAVLGPAGIAALTNGTFDIFSDVNAYPLDFAPYLAANGTVDLIGENTTELNNALVRMSGPLFSLPGGAVLLSGLLETREQLTTASIASAGQAYVYNPPYGSTTDSVYAELTVPLISAGNRASGIHGLEAQASYRRDETETRSRSLQNSQITVPTRNGPFPDIPFERNRVTGDQFTVGLRYLPLEGLALRTSYGEGILPPSNLVLTEVDLPTFILPFLGLTDPKRDNQLITSVDLLRGVGNVALLPEHSRSFSVGLVMQPRFLAGLRLSVDLTEIRKKDEIATLSNWQTYLDLEDQLISGNIVRDPLTQQDAALGYEGGRIAQLNFGYVNLARTKVRTVDIQLDHAWTTRAGEFGASAIASYQPDYAFSVVPGSPEIERAGYQDVLKWRGNLGLTWSSGSWKAGWNMQYYDGAFIYAATANQVTRDLQTLNQGSPVTPAQAYHDLFFRYRFDAAPSAAGRVLGGAELLVSLQNVFDDEPPILATVAGGVGSYRSPGDPRLRRYSLSIRRSFR